MKKFVEKGKKMITLSILAMAVMCGTALAANIDAIVPASLPITVSADGSVVTATNASIQNYGSDPLLVSSINVAGQNGWSLATKDTAATAAIGDKVIAMAFNGQWSDTNGVVNVASFDKIAAKGSLPLKYDAKAPAAKTAESEEAATATFVVKDLSAPTMAAGSSWYKSTVDRNTITKITFMDSYTPSTAADETWFADVDNTGSITCYRTGTEIIIAGDGSGKIKANANASYMFSNPTRKSAFQKLSSFEGLNLLDTSQVTNMSYMFYYCLDLTNLDASPFNTFNVTNMDSMFSACISLTSLSLSNFDTSHVTSMSSMFKDCVALTGVDVSNFETECVINMSNMFAACFDLTTLDVSHFNTSNTVNMAGMFRACRKLEYIDVSGFNTSNVTNMGGMFDSCSAVTNLDTSQFATSKVTSMASMFKACSSLTSIDVSNFNTSNVTNMGGMFISCENITSLDLSNFDTSNVTIMYDMFEYCSGLTTIYASDKWNTDKVTDSNYMFSGCTKLKGDIAFNSNYVDKTYAKIHGGYLTIKSPVMAAGSSWYKSTVDRNTITKITFMDSYTPSTAADETWFADVDNTGSITCYRTGTEIIIAGNGASKIQANADSSYMLSYSTITSAFEKLVSIENLSLVDTSKATNMSHMFSSCDSLTNLDLSHFDTSGVTNMYSMFGYCRGLTNIDLSGFDTSNVTNMSWMFNWCSKLTSLDVSTFDTSKVENMGFMFRYCEALKILDLSHFNTSNVTDMQRMFFSCTNLRSLNVTNFDTSKTVFMGKMFYKCSRIVSLDLSDFNTSNVTDMNAMFSGCSWITTIYASDKWNTDKVSSSTDMFLGCYDLEGDQEYDSSSVDKTYAKISGGYLTYKAATQKTLSLNIDPNTGTVTSYDVSTSPMSTYKEMIRAVAAA